MHTHSHTLNTLRLGPPDCHRGLANVPQTWSRTKPTPKSIKTPLNEALLLPTPAWDVPSVTEPSVSGDKCTR